MPTSITTPGGDVVGRVSLFDATGAAPTVRVNAGGPTLGQSLKTYVGTQSLAAATPITLETVTAGKTFYVTDIYVGANSATPFAVTINAGATAIFQGFCKGDTGPVALMGIETQPAAGTGAVVQLVLGTAAATTAAYMIAGYEQ